MKNLNLKMKLLLLFLAVGVIPLTIISLFSYVKAKSALENSYFNQLSSINGIKKVQVQSFYDDRIRDIENFANDPSVIQAMKELDSVGHDALQNQFSGPRMLEYDIYREAHDVSHPQLKDIMEKYGYYNIYLLGKSDGMIVYSGLKEADFGAMVTKENSHFAEAWKAAATNSKTYITDIKLYTPSNGAPAQFISTPIKDGGEVIGVLALQVSLKQIDKIMANREGMGQTGESYLVGADKLMRSDSFQDKENYSLEASLKKSNKVDTESVTEAFSGKSGTHMISSYNGHSVLSDFEPVDIGKNGIKWAILSEIDDDEAFESARNLRLFLIIITAVVAALVGGIGFYFGNSIANPILSYAEQLKEASESVYTAAESVSSSSQQLSEASTEQASSIEETSASLEEMTGMVNNNVENAEKSAQITEKVRASATQGNESMKNLISSMKDILDSNEKIQELVKVIGEIGDKTAVIDEIVFQTKLLSFNASVEAERAGEHGRGFAVVAQEVGNLAQMSGKAATEISSIVKESIRTAEVITLESKKKVETGNQVVKETAKVLQDITENAEIVSRNATQIVNASKEQAGGIGQINNAMAQLDKTTQENAATSEEVASSSEELTAQSESLSDIVAKLTEMVTGSSDGLDGEVVPKKRVSLMDKRVKAGKPKAKQTSRTQVAGKLASLSENNGRGRYFKKNQISQEADDVVEKKSKSSLSAASDDVDSSLSGDDSDWDKL